MISMMKPQDFLRLRHINRVWLYMFRLLEPSVYLNQCETSKQKMVVFAQLHSWVSKQGSQAWLDQRNGTYSDFTDTLISEIYGNMPRKQVAIGGSEIASVLGENPYGSRRKLAKQKLGISVFRGSIDTRWGKMFEPVLNLYTEKYFNTVITEMGSIPGVRRSGRAISSYSPDGIGIVDANTLREKLGYSVHGATVVLFEFKCPRKRIPNGKVPNHYISQPKKGLCVIPMCTMGIFGDAMFRKCSIFDFNYGDSYDRSFHPDSYTQVSAPVALGVIGFYERSPITMPVIPEYIYDPEHPDPYKIPLIVEYLAKYNVNIVSTIRGLFPDLCEGFVGMITHCMRAQHVGLVPGIDFGSHQPDFEDIVEQAVDSGFNIWYPDTFADSEPGLWLEIQFEKFSQFCTEHNYSPVGVMPWKLFKIHFMPIQKDPNYLSKIVPEIEQVVSGIQDIYAGKSINEVFPKSAEDHVAYKKYTKKYKTPKPMVVNLPADPMCSWFTADELASI